ncbi:MULTISPECIES: hypothetical protein [Chryseobacterium]|uniref:Peptidoglycan hydrolase CwlO-like protein n=1 Tax=Chryseobacterium geocarposphaerae TaxID=1416776 RepID=A0ABU1L9Y3_9FLAO|nr:MULTISPECIES: hypothetical protein [Chryseobacterium]MDR6403524.1 peptidoglycan hydrolase CwlO-like protein [Chryseobacterium geocarposphaerae]MDR6697078.1 peptidoglycan hydrolase CwlO-like protein [Chryseobacterium ginsenosidimutans]
MRKIIFSLLATSLFSVSALAGNTIVKNNSIERKSDQKLFQLCGVSVAFYDAQGRFSGYQLFTSDQPNLSSCISYQNSVISGLKAQGYTVKVQNMDSSVN